MRSRIFVTNKIGRKTILPYKVSAIESNGIFCIAKSSARDPKGVDDYTKISMKKRTKGVDNISAEIIANVFTQCFFDKSKEILKSNGLSDRIIKEIFTSGNKSIKHINDKEVLYPNYLDNDFSSSVSCGGIIRYNKLYWGHIGDCGIVVFDKKNHRKFHTISKNKNFEQALKNEPLKNYCKASWRFWQRWHYRNNENLINDNECYGYGELTGEPSAISFLKSGILKLDPYDMVVFYSNGFTESLNNPLFNKLLYDDVWSKENKAIKYMKELNKKNAGIIENLRFSDSKDTIIAIIV